MRRRDLLIGGAAIAGLGVACGRYGIWPLDVGAARAQPRRRSPFAPAVNDITLGAGPHTLTLRISQDYYLANARYLLFVDGKQIGGTFEVEATRTSGAADTINIRGDWPDGPHSVTVSFLNDVYAGAGRDRNMYVDQALFDGVDLHVSLNLLKRGPKSFTFNLPLASAVVRPPTKYKLPWTPPPVRLAPAFSRPDAHLARDRYGNFYLSAGAWGGSGLTIARPGTYNLNGSNLSVPVGGKGPVDVSLRGRQTIIVNDFSCVVATNPGDTSTAGIRDEGGSYTATFNRFHTSGFGNGVMTGAGAGSNITLDRFLIEGMQGNGYSHGIYAGRSDLVTIRNGTVLGHGITGTFGHLFKSRAKKTVITGCVGDMGDGHISRLVDLSDGGELIVTDCKLSCGKNGLNRDAFGIALESKKQGLPSLTITNCHIDLAGRYYLCNHGGVGFASLNISGNTIVNAPPDWAIYLPPDVMTKNTVKLWR